MKAGDRMSKNSRKIPAKNYAIIGLIAVITFVFLGYFVFWYKSNLEYQAKKACNLSPGTRVTLPGKIKVIG